MTELELLERIDAKLIGILGLLTMALPTEQRDGVTPILRTAGLSTAEIAQLLGKSQRWVQLALK
jgi:hypothetical protein